MRRRHFGAAVAAGAAGLAVGIGHRAWAQAPAEGKVIPVVARKFVFLPTEIKLQKGQPVVFEFTAPEVVMGFYAPDLQLRAVIVPGQVARVPFVPQRVGSFDFLCDIFCGDGHEGMSGHIIVTA